MHPRINTSVVAGVYCGAPLQLNSSRNHAVAFRVFTPEICVKDSRPNPRDGGPKPPFTSVAPSLSPPRTSRYVRLCLGHDGCTGRLLEVGGVRGVSGRGVSPFFSPTSFSSSFSFSFPVSVSSSEQTQPRNSISAP